MFIKGIGTAVPGNRYSQQECWEALCEATQFEGLTTRSRAVLKRVLTGENGIQTRHLALDRLSEAFEISPDTLHARFAKHAPALACEAARRAMEEAGVSPKEIEAVVVSTCTGYLCPGLSSYVSEALGLRASSLGLDLVGQGCGAALPNMAAAEGLLACGRSHVLSICVEVCSAAFYLDNDVGVLVSACIFGDGAGAVVLGREPGRLRIRVRNSSSTLMPEHREALRFQHRNGLLRNVLTPEVPGIAAGQVKEILQRVLTAANVSRSAITGWIVHPGGREVLKAVSEALDLGESDLSASASVLRQYGNLSSPSVFFVLERALKDSVPGGTWWLSSFGAGFSCYGALLEVER